LLEIQNLGEDFEADIYLTLNNTLTLIEDGYRNLEA